MNPFGFIIFRRHKILKDQERDEGREANKQMQARPHKLVRPR